MIMKISFAIFAVAFHLISPSSAIDMPYVEFETDQSLLRDNYEVKSEGKNIKASTEKAGNAARRIFSNISFLFKTREEVLKVLGDPSTISDYGIKLSPEIDSTIIYRFDTGFGGTEYQINFFHNKVVGVEFRGLE